MAGPCGKVAGVVLLVLGGPEICVIDRHLPQQSSAVLEFWGLYDAL